MGGDDKMVAEMTSRCSEGEASPYLTKMLKVINHCLKKCLISFALLLQWRNLFEIAVFVIGTLFASYRAKEDCERC